MQQQQNEPNFVYKKKIKFNYPQTIAVSKNDMGHIYIFFHAFFE